MIADLPDPYVSHTEPAALIPNGIVRRVRMPLGILVQVGQPCACGRSDGGVVQRPDGSCVPVCRQAWEADGR